eukprot:scaffold265080_cov19-Tisochrysis_lutea.AAC.1
MKHKTDKAAQLFENIRKRMAEEKERQEQERARHSRAVHASRVYGSCFPYAAAQVKGCAQAGVSNDAQRRWRSTFKIVSSIQTLLASCAFLDALAIDVSYIIYEKLLAKLLTMSMVAGDPPSLNHPVLSAQPS